ncbi:MAG: hypothetical protein R3Y39_08310 [Rikenellaceae bacterium]
MRPICLVASRVAMLQQLDIPIENMAYNYGSTTDGFMSGQTICFGIYMPESGAPTNQLSLNLKPSTGVMYGPIIKDITNDINVVTDNNLVMSVEVAKITIE